MVLYDLISPTGVSVSLSRKKNSWYLWSYVNSQSWCISKVHSSNITILNNIRLSSWHLPLLSTRLQSGKGMAWLIVQGSWHSDFQVLGVSCSGGCFTHEAESFLKVRRSKLWTKGEDTRWGKQRPGSLVPIAIRLNAIKPGIRIGADNRPGGQSLVG